MPSFPRLRRPAAPARTASAGRADRSRTACAAVGALGIAGLIACGAAPAAVADDAADHLVVGSLAPVDGVKPGSSFDVPVTVANKGTKAADKVWVDYVVTRGLDFASLPSNCVTYHVTSYDEMPDKWVAECEFDQAVQPGVVYAPEKPLAVAVQKRAYHDDLQVSVQDTEPGPGDGGTSKPVRGTAPAVGLVEKPGGTAGTDSSSTTQVTADNTADFKVTGAHVKGDVGDTVPFQVKFTNAGPAWVQHDEETSIVHVLVTPPAGTSIVKPDGFCDAKGDAYECGTSERWVDEDGGETYTFKLKIDKKVAGAKGSVALETKARPFDTDKADDKADIVLDGTGSGAASGTGAGSSSGGPTPDGALAATGSSSATLPAAGAAGVALAVGAGTLVVVRRRRAQGRG